MDTHARLGAYRALRRELEESILPLAGRRSTGARSRSRPRCTASRCRSAATSRSRPTRGPLLAQVQALEVATRDAAELALARRRRRASRRRAWRCGSRSAAARCSRATARRSTTRTVRPPSPRRSPRGSSAARRAARGSTSASSRSSPACRSRSTPAGSTATRSCAASRARARRTRSACCSSGCCCETTLRIVVLDPNSDHVRIGEVRGDVDGADGEPLRAASRASSTCTAPARAAATGCGCASASSSPPPQSALLRLDPVADLRGARGARRAARRRAPADARGVPRLGPPGHAAARAARAQPGHRPARRVGARAIRARPLEAAARHRAPRRWSSTSARCATRTEQSLTAAAVLGGLWERREERSPVLIVIDEAHNVCPAEPEDRLTALATEHAVRIAAEGRKFGLYLLVCTQRPQKVHPNVVTPVRQPRPDAAELDGGHRLRAGGVLVRPRRAARARPGARAGGGRRRGEDLPVGRARCASARRISHEGGADVPSDWAGSLGRRRGARARVRARHPHRRVELGGRALPRKTPLIGGTSE